MCIINDSDIRVSPHYLTRVMECFSDRAGGHGDGSLYWPNGGGAAGDDDLVAAGGAGDFDRFLPGVLAARRLEGGIRFGLGSTLAMSRWRWRRPEGWSRWWSIWPTTTRWESASRRRAIAWSCAARWWRRRCPAYNFRGFRDHQLRWARSTRDSRKLGYVGLGITYALPWAMMTCVASGFALWSFSLLSVVVLARVAVALSVGVGVLRDGQVLRDLWLLPLRDFFGLGFWAWSFAGDTVVWRGELFHLRDGRISHVVGGVPPLLPARNSSCIQWFTGIGCLQNIHNKGVASKIFHLNELAPEGVRGFARFRSIYPV